MVQIGADCLPVRFDDVYGNPPVLFDSSHIDLVESLVPIDSSEAVYVMTEQFDDHQEDDVDVEKRKLDWSAVVESRYMSQIIQLTSGIDDQNCPQGVPGAPEVITVGYDGESYWLHTTMFKLLDNQMESPLVDGGLSAVEATIDAPSARLQVRCSNVPRSFLNEDHCVFSDENACIPEQDLWTDHATLTIGQGTIICGSPNEVGTAYSENSGTVNRGGFTLQTTHNRTYGLDTDKQKQTVWIEIALKGKDQLRQKVAWALSQILVISPESFDTADLNENFVNFYDIFGKSIKRSPVACIIIDLEMCPSYTLSL